MILTKVCRKGMKQEAGDEYGCRTVDTDTSLESVAGCGHE